MRKIVLVLLDDINGAVSEAHFRIPTAVADKLDMELLETTLEDVFGKAGIEILSIEKIEECRTSLNRRWDDVKTMKDGEVIAENDSFLSMEKG